EGVAVLIVSSELDEIYALADRIAVMYEGRIVAFCPPTIPEQELGLLMAGSQADGSTAPGPAGEPETPVPAQEPGSHEGPPRRRTLPSAPGGPHPPRPQRPPPR